MDLKTIDKNRIAVAGVVLAGFFVLWPMMHRAHDLESQNRLAEEKIRLINDFARNKSNDSAGRLIALNEASTALDEITALGNKHSVVFLTMVCKDRAKPGRVKSNTINTLPVEVETQSTYRQLGLFLDGLNGLDKSIVLVDGFQIAADKREPDKVASKIRLNIGLKN